MKNLGLFLICIFAVFGSAYSQENQPDISPWIFVNHLGYLPSSQKIAVVSSTTGLPFELVQLLPEPEKERTAFRGMLKLAQAHDTLSGAHVWVADFSMISATGTYRVQVPGIGMSYPFQIMPKIYSHTAHQALKSFYFHRSGVELPKKYASDWSRPAAQNTESVIFQAGAENAPVKSATGGWYDGNGMERYVPSGAFAAGLLLQLYECKPHLFEDGSIGIPEFRNGIPDILDETRWELEWLMRMQKEDGSVFHKLTAKEPKAAAEKRDDDPIYLLPPSTSATAAACAVLVKASRVYQQYDPQFASKCFNASVISWNNLIQNPEAKPFENPEGFLTKSYTDQDDSDERIWAAAEMFVSTGDPKFYTALQLLTEKRVPLLSSAGYWSQVMPLAAGTIILHSTPFLESKILREIHTDLESMADTIVEKTGTNGFRISIKPDEMLWGSNSALLQNALILFMAHQVKPKPQYKNSALDQLHYVLGRNPLSMCYVTGNGHISPKHPFHFYRNIAEKEKPVPGLLVAGPNASLSDGVVKKAFPAGTPPARIYRDEVESFSTNETAITWNAVLTYVTAWMDDVE